MAGVVLCWRRRLCSSAAAAAWSNRNGVISRAFSATKEAPIDKVEVNNRGVRSMAKETKGSNNWELFESWRARLGRSYKSEKEKLFRYRLFCGAVKRVEKMNKESTNGCTFRLSGFADRTHKERSKGIMVSGSRR